MSAFLARSKTSRPGMPTLAGAPPAMLAVDPASGGVGSDDPRLAFVVLGPTTTDLTLTSSYANVDAMFTNVLPSSTYFFHFHLRMSADAATTGLDLSPGGTTDFDAANTSWNVGWWSADQVWAVNSVAGALQYDTAHATSGGTSKVFYQVWGLMVTGATGGTFGPRVKRENVGSGKVHAGSWGWLRRLG